MPRCYLSFSSVLGKVRHLPFVSTFRDCWQCPLPSPPRPLLGEGSGITREKSYVFTFQLPKQSIVYKLRANKVVTIQLFKEQGMGGEFKLGIDLPKVKVSAIPLGVRWIGGQRLQGMGTLLFVDVILGQINIQWFSTNFWWYYLHVQTCMIGILMMCWNEHSWSVILVCF